MPEATQPGATPTSPNPDTANTQPTTTPSQPGTDKSEQNQPDTKPNDAGKDPSPDAGKKPEGDLLFAKKPEGDKKPDAKAADKPPIADQKKFLEGKVDPKLLEGKSDEEISKLFDEQKAKEGDSTKEVEYNFALPKDVKPIPEMIEGLKTFAKNNKLSPEAAQEIVNMGVELQNKQLAQWNDLKGTWRDQVRSDPVLGGHNLEKSIATAEKVVARFGGDEKQIQEMQDDLVLLGLGNKASFIRFCNNIARATGEDKMEGSSQNNAANQPKDLATTMWPNMPGDKK